MWDVSANAGNFIAYHNEIVNLRYSDKHANYLTYIFLNFFFFTYSIVI